MPPWVPYAYVGIRDPAAFTGITHYGGEQGLGGAFDVHLFGAALTVDIALITQIGEQADYLRFMPAQTAQNRTRWWLCVLLGGAGLDRAGRGQDAGRRPFWPTWLFATACRWSGRWPPRRCLWWCRSSKSM